VEYACQSDRMLQALFLADLINQTQGPLIILADFNLRPETAEMKEIFKTGVKDATIEAGTNTFTEVICGEGHIDYILFRDLRLISAFVGENYDASDHRPVVATFGLLA